MNRIARNKSLLKLLPLYFFVFISGIQHARADEFKTLELVDVHRHVQHWISPSQLQSEMQELNIGWAGGVGAPYGPWDTKPYSQLLGNRYVATTGQVTLGDIYKYKGVEGIENSNTVEYGPMFQEAEKLFATGSLKGFGELILNNEHSNPNPSFRRKAKIDSNGIKNIFKVAKKWGVFVHIHAEDDVDSVQQIENIAQEYPTVPIILAHCLFTPDVKLINRLLTTHNNLYCEMSARYESMFSGFFAKRIATRNGWIVYDDSTLLSDWKILIEKHSDRFMVGSDTFNASVDIQKAVKQIRYGLLANLTPEVAKLVASENAIRVMKLER